MMSLLSKNRWRYAPYIYSGVAAVWIIYAVLSLVTATYTPNQYHLPLFNLYLLDLSILLPVLAIWLLAARGVIHFVSYALLVRNTPEGPGLISIAHGVSLLLVYLVSIGLLGVILPYFHGATQDFLVIVKNHLPALIAFLSFLYLYLGSVKLYRTPSVGLTPNGKIIPTAIFLVAATLFTWAFWISPTDTLTQATGAKVYATPHNVLMFSLVLPYLCAWLLALHASINIADYAKNVKGAIYRTALGNLAKGIMASAAFTVALQLLTVATPILKNFKLGSILLVLYLLIGLYALGAYYITAGSRKLTLIEVAE